MCKKNLLSLYLATCMYLASGCKLSPANEGPMIWTNESLDSESEVTSKSSPVYVICLEPITCRCR